MDFEFDLAISLLDQDIELAREIAGLLGNRVPVFLYSENQKDLAASDGMEKFTAAFRRNARSVLVLTRKEWGHTRWTRVEETAIKNRGFAEGWDFLTFVPLDGSESVPDWIPQTYIWADLERLGIPGLVAVLERKLRELGSAVRPETALDLHARLEREKNEARDREKFLRSPNGFAAANTAFGQLQADLESKGKQLKMHVSTSQSPYPSIKLTLNRLSLSVTWLRQYSNSLDSSELQVKLWDGILSDHLSDAFRAKTSKDLILEFDTLAGLHGWREYKGRRRFFSSPDLAEHALKALLNAVSGGKREL